MAVRACRWLACAALALTGCGGGDAPSDGRFFGYIRDVDGPARTIELDGAEFLTGAAAQNAAEEDGAVRRLELADTARVTAVRCPTSCSEGHPRDLADFLRSFEARSQYWVTVVDGRVVAIDEQYLP